MWIGPSTLSSAGGTACVFPRASGACFNVLDNIEEAEHSLGDWNWIGIGVDSLKALPYRSKGWYARSCTAYLLDRPKCTWDNIKFTFSSEYKLPKDAFKAGIDVMVDAWDEKHLGETSY